MRMCMFKLSRRGGLRPVAAVSQCEGLRVPSSHSSFAIPTFNLTVRRPTISHFHALDHGTQSSARIPIRTVLVIDTVSPFLSGSIADIDCNITFLQNSLSLYPRSHSKHIICLYNLARVRWARYQLSREKQGLDMSIAHCTQAEATFRPFSEPNIPSMRSDVSLTSHILF